MSMVITLTYAWAFSSVPLGSTATLSSLAAVMPTFVVDLPGDYVVELIVSDGVLFSLADTVTISTDNSPPVADAGPDQSVFVTDTVFLDGTGSSDVDGDPLTYAWSFFSIPAGSAAVLSDTTAEMPTFVIDLPGTYVVELIVNDGTVSSAPDTVAISTENTAPVADAGPDQTAFVTDTVTLDGSGSSDADGDPLSYAWSFSSVPAGSIAMLSDTTAEMPTFVIDLPGTYVVQLIVHDGTVSSAPDTVSISTDNSAPTADPQSVSTAEDTGLGINLTGSDPDGDPMSFAIATGPTHGVLTGTPPSMTYTPGPNYFGPDSFTFTATDGVLTSLPATVSITVTPVNDRPTADDQSVSTPEDTALGIILTGGDVDGDALTFVIGSGPTHGALTGTPPSVTYTPDADYHGPDSFTYTASDGALTSAPATVSITVTPVNDAPLAAADSATTDEDVAISISVLTNDALGDPPTTITAVTQGTRGSVAIDPGATSVTYTPNPNTNGLDSFTYTITDLDLQTSTATVSMTVTPVNDAPVADAGPDQTVFVTDTVTLDGSGSSDVDGDTLTYAWSFFSVPVGSTATLSSLTAVMPTFVVDLPGDYVVELIVSDGVLFSVADTVTISTDELGAGGGCGSGSVGLRDGYGLSRRHRIIRRRRRSPDLRLVVLLGPGGERCGALGHDGGDADVCDRSAGDLCGRAHRQRRHGLERAGHGRHQHREHGAGGGCGSGSDGLRDRYGDPRRQRIFRCGRRSPELCVVFLVGAGGEHCDALGHDGGDADVCDRSAGDLCGPAHRPRRHGFERAGHGLDHDRQLGADGGPAVGLDGGGHGAGDHADGLRPGWRRDQLCRRHGSDARHGDGDAAECDLHTGTELLRSGQLHLHRERRCADLGAGDGVDHGHPGQRPADRGRSVGLDPEDTAKAITLTGGDVDGDALTFVIGAGPTHGALTGTPPSVTYTPDADYHGPDSFTFTTTDGVLISTIATVSITVTPVNDAPVADAGPDQTVFVTDTVTLDGSGSSDVDGDTVTYAWSFFSVPVGSTATLSSLTAVMPTFVVDLPGDYVVELIVSDGVLFSVADTVTISADNDPWIWFVATDGNDANDCLTTTTACLTISEAVSRATAGDLVNVARGVYPEHLVLGVDLTLAGEFRKGTVIDGGGSGVVIEILPATTVIMSYLEITGGAIGGIANEGDLTLGDSWIHDNGDGSPASFGGLSNLGTASIDRVAMTANLGDAVGGLSNAGDLQISNSTISGNGSGIENHPGATLEMHYSTVAANGTLGIRVGGTISLRGSIVAGHTIANCDFSVVTLGHNLEDADTCGLEIGAGDLIGVDPLLTPLGFNGGSSPTHAVTDVSPAIDAGEIVGGPVTDQRGVARPIDGNLDGAAESDIGAFEFIPGIIFGDGFESGDTSAW